MISNLTGSIDREVTPCQGQLKQARTVVSLAAAPTFAIMALLTAIHVAVCRYACSAAEMDSH